MWKISMYKIRFRNLGEGRRSYGRERTIALYERDERLIAWKRRKRQGLGRSELIR